MGESKTTIAIVDDEVIIRKSLEMVLEKNGYQVISLKNGKQTLKLIEKESPHIFILDIALPDITGHLLARKIRQVIPNVKIILLTGYSPQNEGETEQEENNISHILFKPVDVPLLLSSIEEVLGD